MSSMLDGFGFDARRLSLNGSTIEARRSGGSAGLTARRLGSELLGSRRLDARRARRIGVDPFPEAVQHGGTAARRQGSILVSSASAPHSQTF